MNTKFLTTNFLAFDGESSAENYWLLACSNGDTLIRKPMIEVEEAINFLGQSKFRDTVNVFFAMGYDINKIFQYAPKDVQKELFRDGETEFCGFNIRYIPRKIFRLQRLENNNNHSVVFYDTWGFFQSSFVKALETWKIEVPENVKKLKQERNDFDKLPDSEIIAYNATECRLLVELMNRLQEKLEFVKLSPLRGYHGAGAISSFMLRELGAKNFFPKELPEKVKLLRRRAYFGGRIELLQRGEFHSVHHYDINSCYPTAITQLPSLAEGKWYEVEKVTKSDLKNFGIVNVSWRTKPDGTRKMAPFPFRLKSGYVLFPLIGRGAYHSIEVRTALDKNEWEIDLLSGIFLEPPYTFPFKKYIEEKMRDRLKFKAMKDGANIPIKLGANGLYGKLAQRPTKTSPSPQYRELIYAGYTTAYGRSELLKYANPESAILFATDGLFSETKLACPIGNDLGQWEYSLHEKGRFVLAGIYQVDEELKSRGMKTFDFDKNWSVISNGKQITHTERLFVGIKKALAQSKYKAAQFVEIPRTVNWNNNYKRGGDIVGAGWFSKGSSDWSMPNSNVGNLIESFPYIDSLADAIERQTEGSNTVSDEGE